MYSITDDWFSRLAESHTTLRGCLFIDYAKAIVAHDMVSSRISSLRHRRGTTMPGYLCCRQPCGSHTVMQ